jgi:hypothetical protein
MGISEKQLKKITCTMLLDFCNMVVKHEMNLPDFTVAAVKDYCDNWVKLNVNIKEFDNG